jgi:DNA-binding IclR family transcriptional regulator
MREIEQQYLDAIPTGVQRTNRDVCEGLGISNATGAHIINKLVSHGLLKKHGKHYNASYSVTGAVYEEGQEYEVKYPDWPVPDQIIELNKHQYVSYRG